MAKQVQYFDYVLTLILIRDSGYQAQVTFPESLPSVLNIQC